MTVETFHDRFVPDFKLETKEVVEYINELEATIYEKNQEIKELHEQEKTTPIKDV